MAGDCAVTFEGRRWPGIRVEKPTRRGFGLTASGEGQRWSTSRTLAFWRNFSDLNMSSNFAVGVERFLRRHGDPTGQMDRCAAIGEQIVSDTSSWDWLIEDLKQVAAVWDEPDALGVSRWSADPPRLAAAGKALRRLLPTDPDADWEIKNEIKPAYTTQGLTLQPQTLRAFMVASAASAHERGINMRRCAYCEDWFELRRSDAVYCSPSCQATDHKRRSANG